MNKLKELRSNKKIIISLVVILFVLLAIILKVKGKFCGINSNKKCNNYF